MTRANVAPRWLLILLGAVAPAFIYAPLSLEPLWAAAFVSLVPWALLVLLAARAGPLLGFLAIMPAFAAMHRSLEDFTVLSQPIIAAEFLIPIVGSAFAVRELARRTRLPLALVVAALWTGSELARTNVVFAPWHRLATALYAHPWALQICDLGGISALSFALASTSGAVTGLLLARLWPGARPRHAPAWQEIFVAAGIWAFVGGYGAFRLHEARRTVREGPEVVVVETDFFPDDARALGKRRRIAEIASITRDAIERRKKADPSFAPGLVVWPEYVLDGSISPEYLRATPDEAMAAALLTDEQRSGDPNGDRAAIAADQARGRSQWTWLEQAVAELKVPVLVGGEGIGRRGRQWARFNSAYLVTPGGPEPDRRHDKTLPFPVYEAVPFADSSWLPLQVMHRLLARLRAGVKGSPPPIRAGEHATIFYLGEVPFAAPICHELETEVFELRPELRGEGRPRFYTQIANDSWANRGDDLLRAFRFNVFRSVEARVGIARSANAGVTGFTSPTGEIYGVVGGERAARMPGPGRPERADAAEVERLTTERESISLRLAHATGVESEVLRASLHEIDERVMRLRARVLETARRVGTVGTSAARVRVDSRESLYVATNGMSDTLLLAAWWGCFVGLLIVRWRPKGLRAACGRNSS